MKKEKYTLVFILTVIGLFALLLLAVEAAPVINVRDVLADGKRPLDETNTTVFLPLIQTLGWKDLIKLAGPADGSQLDTLIPQLVFDTGRIPPNTEGCLSLYTGPDPQTCFWYFTFLTSDMHFQDYPGINLQPDSIYYWRVGASVIDWRSGVTTEWSEQWSFTTGPGGGVILPKPELVAPVENSKLAPLMVTLQWEAVSGALAYDVTLYDRDDDRQLFVIEGIVPPLTQVGPDVLAQFFEESKGTDFAWYVRVRNSYAWGEDSEIWNFTLVR